MRKQPPHDEPIHDYHLVDFRAGISHGGFASLEAARVTARELGLPSWEIFHANKRVEHHDPDAP